MTTVDFCLLIPCYNNTPGLLRSLASVHYKGPFSILVVDDGSRQPILQKELTAVLSGSPSLFLLRNETNQGIVHALNHGLDYIREHIPCRYIARLDAGDTCQANRFEQQIRLMDSRPELALTGTWCRFFTPGAGHHYIYRSALTHYDILREMHIKCSFIHPSVVFRKSILEKYPQYPGDFPHAEDYAYFWQMLREGEGAVLPDILVHCELNPRGISLKNRKHQLWSRLRIIRHFGRFPLTLKGYARILLLLIVPYSVILTLKKKKTRDHLS